MNFLATFRIVTKESNPLKKIKLFTLRKMCPYSELFWSAFSCDRTRITPDTGTFYAVLLAQNWGKDYWSIHIWSNKNRLFFTQINFSIVLIASLEVGFLKKSYSIKCFKIKQFIKIKHIVKLQFSNFWFYWQLVKCLANYIVIAANATIVSNHKM